MLFMSKSKNKKALFITCGAILLVGVAVLSVIYMDEKKGPPGQIPAEVAQADYLRTFVDAANDVSGIESGAAFDYSFVEYGNSANFGILRCLDEVRCDHAVGKQVAKFQQPNQPSPDSAEVDAETNQIVSLHRAVPGFLGDEYPEEEIESRAREFLNRVYPNFSTIESTLTFNPGMKGVRLNNGNYFYRWDDESYVLPDGLSTDVPPFIQVGITASGFIFGYDNTIDLYRSALAEL
jgi:hypothetical protein